MNETTPAGTQPPATAPGGPPIPNDLRIVDWLDPGMIEFGACPDLTTAVTVGEAAVTVRELFARLANSDYFIPAVFVGTDGQFYTVEVDVVIRHADADEVRESVERELEDIKRARVREAEPALDETEEEERADFLTDRTEILTSYLARADG